MCVKITRSLSAIQSSQYFGKTVDSRIHYSFIYLFFKNDPMNYTCQYFKEELNIKVIAVSGKTHVTHTQQSVASTVLYDTTRATLEFSYPNPVFPNSSELCQRCESFAHNLSLHQSTWFYQENHSKFSCVKPVHEGIYNWWSVKINTLTRDLKASHYPGRQTGTMILHCPTSMLPVSYAL